jgi:uncharacterized membrane protein (DUF2068 family)
MAKRRLRNKGLFAIALTKFVHAFIVLVATVAALNLLHKNVPLHIARWVDMLRLDPDNRFIASFLWKLRVVHTRELKELSALGFFYVGLFAVEGVGLLLEKRWAEWLTLLATSLFIPMEVYSLCTEANAAKALLLLANLAIVIFLAWLLWRKRSRD